VDGKRVVQLEQRQKAVSKVLGTWPVSGAVGVAVELRIAVRADSLDFAMRTGTAPWQSLLTGADGRMLSTKVSGGFVGTMFGLYAYAEPQ
jgi:alpha-N-arabinofuranosidase